ncbi:hypothetical protein DNJ95_06435 [Stutzerimonas kirkiae]|uniref:Uncharacterized protein n=1 Tax=Stutzerimonas kirkiae TaxID=2211392 RepID=A0A4Q9REI9_9GAMM|nr:hypothetical protein DNJ96_04025 [Stutzerimonas kirkiae]TBV03982.1 hypothetical protein DNJ95_06435 [Stutzerimonas kirkiae]
MGHRRQPISKQAAAHVAMGIRRFNSELWTLERAPLSSSANHRIGATWKAANSSSFTNATLIWLIHTSVEPAVFGCAMDVSIVMVSRSSGGMQMIKVRQGDLRRFFE